MNGYPPSLIKRLATLLLVVLLTVINVWNAFHSHKEGSVKRSTTSCIVKDDSFGKSTHCTHCKYKFLLKEAANTTIVVTLRQPVVSIDPPTTATSHLHTATRSASISRGPPAAQAL